MKPVHSGIGLVFLQACKLKGIIPLKW